MNKENANNLQLTASQRYFHLVAFKYDSAYSSNLFWKDCGIISKKTSKTFFDNEKFTIEQNIKISDLRFFFGENSNEDYSLENNGRPPFKYDILFIDLKKIKISIWGFPFKSFARATLNDLINKKGLLRKGNFIKTDLNKLIRVKKTDSIDENFTSHFSGLELIFTSDRNLTSVNLEGDKPLESPLYKSVFKDKIKEKLCQLERCTIKSEILNEFENVPKTKSNIHFDLFGNYKLYVHGSGKNLFTIPYMFLTLSEYKCLEPTTINPIERLKEDEQI